MGSSNRSISTTVQKVESSSAIVSILKRCSDKKTERVIKSPAFLLSTAIWSHSALPWPGLNFMSRVKYKALGNR